MLRRNVEQGLPSRAEKFIRPQPRGNHSRDVSYRYNELRRLTAYDDGTTAASYAYDNLQRKTQETVNYGPFNLSYAYSYYGNGQKKSFTAPDGVSYAYTYDPNNQLSAIQLPTGAITVNAYTWTAPERITLPGGTTRSHQYDPRMRLTTISAKDAFQNSLLSYQYSYDKAGNITNKATEHGTYSYGYDNLYRLKTAANPGPLTNEAYSYDALGNRTTDSNLPGPWSYDENNALLAAGAVTFDYDANGNAIKKTEGAQTLSLAYDISDRLTEAKDAQGNTLARYAYDPFGRRLWKETNNTKTYFLYSDEGLIGEYDSSGAQAKAYGYRPKSTWTTDPVFLKTNNYYYFYQADHLGTPQKLTDTQGNVVWSARAQVFGATTVDASFTVTNNLRFAGQYYDQETGLHYNWNRYYDPKVGRYITSDPIGLKGGMNTYLYVRANPLRFKDSTGLIGWGGDPFFDDGDISPPPPPPYDNGNYRPGFDDQDWRCSSLASPFNFDKCSKQCCIEHDACYKKYGCNDSSWRGNFIANYGNPCQICNIDVTRCILRNFGKSNCGSPQCKPE